MNARWAIVGLLLCLQGCAGGAAVRSGPGALERQILVTMTQHASSRLPAGTSAMAYQRGGEYQAGAATRRVARRLQREHELTAIEGWPITRLNVYCYVFELPPAADPDSVIAALRADPRVEAAQKMGVFRALGARPTRYNDPLWKLQHYAHDLQVDAAHQFASGAGVRIAVVDTGVDVAHPELRDRVDRFENFVPHEPDVFNSDQHGTAVAGLISSLADNNIGIVGVAPAARLLVFKACWHEEQGAALCSSFTLVKAVAAALDHDAQIINLSLTGPHDPLLARLLSSAVDDGVTVVAARPPGGGFPASLPGVIAVAGVGETGAGLALTAPAADILTIAPDAGFDYLSGSSLAAAQVSGIAALLLERRPRLRPEQVATLLAGSAGRDGVVNACGALLGAGESARCGQTGGVARATTDPVSR